MSKTQIVSWSEIAAHRDCPYKHKLGYVDRWEKDETAPALARGILWHQVMEQHYLAIQAVQQNPGDLGLELARVNARAIDLLLGLDGRQPPSEQQELVKWMYDGYCERWPIELDMHQWRVLAVEHPAEMWLPTGRGGRSRFRLKMKIDLIVRIGGRIWIIDHKSGKDLPKGKMLELDDQFGLYCWGLRQLGHPVWGCIYNSARTYQLKDQTKQMLESRFDRYLLHRTDRELDTIAAEAYATCSRAWGANATAERTPDTDQCNWKCGFVDACLAGRKGSDERQMLIAGGFRQNRERH